jgi:hypothetical protein
VLFDIELEVSAVLLLRHVLLESGSKHLFVSLFWAVEVYLDVSDIVGSFFAFLIGLIKLNQPFLDDLGEDFHHMDPELLLEVW